MFFISTLFLIMLAISPHTAGAVHGGGTPGGDRVTGDSNSRGDTQHSNGGGGGGGGSYTSNTSSDCGEKCIPKNLTCTISANKSTVVRADDPKVTFAFSPSTYGYAGTLVGGGQTFTIPNKVSSVTIDTSAVAPTGSNTFTASYKRSDTVYYGKRCWTYGSNGNEACGPYSKIVTNTYTCSIPLTIVDTVTACNDGIDNDDPEDTLADALDPGCHTDLNPNNPDSYDPDDDDETNDKPNLTARVTAPKTGATGTRIAIRGNVINTTPIGIGASVRNVFRARNITTGATTVTVAAFRTTLDPNETVSRAASLVPDTAGTYEVCFIADYNSELDETDESDNRSNPCATIDVRDDISVSVLLDAAIVTSAPIWQSNTLAVTTEDPVKLRMRMRNAASCTVSGFTHTWNNTPPNNIETEDLGILPSGTYTYSVTCIGGNESVDTDNVTVTVSDYVTPTLKVDPALVRREDSTKIIYNLGGRPSCTLTGGSLNTAVTGSGDVTIDSPAILGETTFTLSCADTSPVTAKVRVLPSLDEI